MPHKFFVKNAHFFYEASEIRKLINGYIGVQVTKLLSPWDAHSLTILRQWVCRALVRTQAISCANFPTKEMEFCQPCAEWWGNGPEYISGTLMTWAEKNDIYLEHIWPGKQQQNAYIERYNRIVRDE